MWFGSASVKWKCYHEYQHKEPAIATTVISQQTAPRQDQVVTSLGAAEQGSQKHSVQLKEDRTETNSKAKQKALARSMERVKGITAAGWGKLWFQGTVWDLQKDCNFYVILFI